MRKRITAVAVVAAVVFAIPVAASADDGEADPETRVRMTLEERFETVEDAVAAITERMNSVLDRINNRLAELEDNEDIPDDVFDRINAAIERIEDNIVTVSGAGDFEELRAIMEEIREERLEARGDRPHRFRRGFRAGLQAAEGSTS